MYRKRYGARVRRALVLALAVVAGLVSRPRVAAAHLTLNARGTTRFVEVAPSGGKVELVYALAYGEYPAERERRKMDLDHNALVSAEEQEIWVRRLGARIAADVAIFLDGSRAPLVFKGKVDMLDTRLGQIAFLAELSASMPLAPGRHQFLVDDRFDPPFPSEHEVGFKEGTGARFESSSRGDRPAGEDRQHRFDGARRTLMEERRVTFRFAVDAAPPVVAAPSGGAPPPARGERWGAGRTALFTAALIGAAALAVVLAKRLKKGARGKA